jgi:hypothetical protein
MIRKFTLLAVVALASSVHADDAKRTVEDWNAEFLASVRRQTPPPCLVARNLAIFHLAIWRAVEQAGRNDQSASAAFAAHEIAVSVFEGDRAGFDALLGKHPTVPSSVSEAARATAAAVLRVRQDDGSATRIHYEPELGPGVWRRTTRNREPELPHWGMVKPFALKSPDQFRPPPPPSLDSAEYAADLREVRELGARTSMRRTRDQQETAHFWSDFSYTSSPVGRWNEIACTALARNDWSLHDKARLFAVLNVALADASIAAWDCKYHYRLWRPVTAIREPLDGGAQSPRSGHGWESLLPAPPHPEYVSGHSTFSGAAATVLTALLGELEEPISVTNRDMPGVRRSFTSFQEIADEAGRSRIFGGIHFSSSNRQGHELGRKVGNMALAHLADSSRHEHLKQ